MSFPLATHTKNRYFQNMLIKITIGEIVKGKLPETTIELPPSTNSYDIKIVTEGIYGAILKAQSGIHSDDDDR